MANSACTSNDVLRVGAVILNDPCSGIAANTKLCCIDNVRATTTTENVVDQKVGAAKCKVRRIDKVSVNLDFDIYGNLSADFMALALPNAEVLQYDSGTPVTETIELTESAWCLDSAIGIPYGNFDGTVPTIVVTGSVDGVLAEGTNYTIEQVEDCVYTDATYASNFITFIAPTDEAQDISISVTYTPATATSIRFQPGNFVSKKLNVTLIGVNKADATDVQTWTAEAYLLYNGNLFTWDDGESELEASNISLEVVEDSIVTGTNISLDSECEFACS